MKFLTDRKAKEENIASTRSLKRKRGVSYVSGKFRYG